MKFSTTWQFLKILILTSVFKVSKASCANVKEEVKCEFVSDVSDRVLNDIPGINEVRRILIQSSSNLTLYAQSFKSAVKLQQLIINYNKINKILPETFKDLPVKYLNLGHNGINSIFPEAFINLSSLDTLRIGDNNLKEIPVGLFKNLPISELTLSKNKIPAVEDMALEGLPNLKKLKLDHNKIQSIFIHKIITHPTRLEILWLHNNSITAISNYMLQNLASLRVLNLGFNSIAMIEPYSFEQTPKLNYLILTHNHLKEIDGRIFPRTGMDYLDKMYLDSNKLMYLPSTFFGRLGSLKRVTLAGNPWICSCLNEVHKFLAENNIVELCNEEYTNGGRPLCVSDKPGDHECTHSYNKNLSEKYENYQKSNPLYRPIITCLL